MTQKIYKGISPLEVPNNEKIVSIAFPSEASSIISLDIPETATIDVSACNDTFVHTLISTPTMTNKVSTANNKIYYTATSKLTETTSNKSSGCLHISKFGVSMISHDFGNGKGTITFSDNVTKFDSYAFYSCKGLTLITIPDSVTSIGTYAFQNCSGLISVTIGNGVTSIGERAFDGCSGLTSVSLGNSVTSIDLGAFYGCSGLTSITIPDSVTSIDSGAFSGCSGLTTPVIWKSTLVKGSNNTPDIPDSVTSIGKQAFQSCSGLTSITIPDSVTSIGSNAFQYCSGLTSITIPDSVTSIGGYAFEGCMGLTSITFKGTTAQWNAIPKGSNWKSSVPTTCQVVCTDGTISI